MNGRTRKKLYQVLANGDGERCKTCSVTPKERHLVIDHIDNDNRNNHPDNLQLLCRRCNFLKNWRPVDKCVNKDYEEISEIEKNRIKESEFRQYVYYQTNQNYENNPKKLINGGAEKVGISPVTAKRYLDKICSSEGLYKICNGRLVRNYDHPLYTGKIESYDGLHLHWPTSEKDHSWIIHRGKPHCNSKFV